MQRTNFNYDKHFDTLRVFYNNGDESYGDDTENGIILLRNMKTEEITGFTIFHFMYKYRNALLPSLPNSVHCSFERDIIPYLK